MTNSDRQNSFSGTKDVAEPLRFDAVRLEDYLRAHVPGFVGPIVVSQFKGGQSNPTYLVETPLRRYVLRRKPPGKLLPSAHAVDREYRVISALYAQDFPVAEPVHYCSDDAIVGTAFFLMAHVDGRVFWDPQMPASDAAERAQVYDAMNATLARLHSFEPAAIGLGDYGRGENYVARQVERWSKQYRASETQPIEEMERLIAWLPARLPPGQPPRVVHGDYRTGNFLYDEVGVIHGVLDWEMAHLGDPLEDLGWGLNRIWCWGGDDRRGGLLPREQAIAIWEKASGLSADPAALHWWELFNCVKGQGIWVSSAKAWADGENRDPILIFSAWRMLNMQDRAALELMGRL